MTERTTEVPEWAASNLAQACQNGKHNWEQTANVIQGVRKSYKKYPVIAG